MIMFIVEWLGMHQERGVPFPWLAGMSVVLVGGNYRSQYQLSTQKKSTQLSKHCKGQGLSS